MLATISNIRPSESYMYVVLHIFSSVLQAQLPMDCSIRFSVVWFVVHIRPVIGLVLDIMGYSTVKVGVKLTE